MQVCPICGNTGTGARFCGNCGFDYSSDSVGYPTLAPLPPSMVRARAEARSRWEQTRGAYAVPKEKIADSVVRVGTRTTEQTIQAGAYAVSGEKLVDHQIKTGAAPAKEQPKQAAKSQKNAGTTTKAAGTAAKPAAGTTAKTAGATAKTAAATAKTAGTTAKPASGTTAKTAGTTVRTAAGTAPKTSTTTGTTSANTPSTQQPGTTQVKKRSWFSRFLGFLMWCFLGALAVDFFTTVDADVTVPILVVALLLVLIFTKKKKKK